MHRLRKMQKMVILRERLAVASSRSESLLKNSASERRVGSGVITTPGQ